MKQTSYEILVKCVMAGAPAMAKEVINDLNDSLEKLDKFEKSTENKATKKKEN